MCVSKREVGVTGMKEEDISCSFLELEMELMAWELWCRKSCVRKSWK